MRRLHLFELEDQPWFPGVIRDAGTGYISKFVELTGMMKEVVPLLARALEHTESRQIVDLCSGAGGPASLMVPGLAKAGHDVTVVCTDLFPNIPALEHTYERSRGRVDFREQPIDATAVPEDLVGLRTIFNAFHHFKPDVARKILEDAVQAKQPIAVFEFVGREPHVILGLLGLPFIVMAILPFLRPFQWVWIPFTYLIPLIPAFIAWDGLVSCLRVYYPHELAELTAGLDSYEWDMGRFLMPGSPGKGTYLVGIPRQSL